MDGLDWIDPQIQSSPVGLGIQSNPLDSIHGLQWIWCGVPRSGIASRRCYNLDDHGSVLFRTL